MSADSHCDLESLDMSTHVNKVIQDLVTQLYHCEDQIQEQGENIPWKISSAFGIIIMRDFS